MNIEKINVHPMERIVSATLGGGLLLRNIVHRSLPEEAIAVALLYRGLTGHSFLYQKLDVNTVGVKEHKRLPEDEAPETERSITIHMSADELYRLWRDPQTLSQIMDDFAEVTEADQNRMHWVLRGPSEQPMEWNTQIMEDRPGEIIRWKTDENAPLSNEASIRFRPAPNNLGTEATLHVRFEPPGNMFGNKILQNLNIVPRLMAGKVLHRYKSLAETGEIPTLKKNPSGRTKTPRTEVKIQ